MSEVTQRADLLENEISARRSPIRPPLHVPEPLAPPADLSPTALERVCDFLQRHQRMPKMLRQFIDPDRAGIPISPENAEGTFRISFFVRSLSGDGAPRDSILLANEIASRGHHVEILTLVPEGTARMQVHERVRIVPVGGNHLRMAVPYLRQALIRHRPDVLISAEAAPNLVALLAARLVPQRIRPRVVLRELGSPSAALRQESQWQNLLAYWGLRALYRLADTVVTLTGGAEQDLQEDFGLAPNKIARMRANAVVDGPVPRPEPREKNLIVSVGRLTRESDHATLLRAFARAAQPGWRLAIVGDGPMRDELNALSLALGVRARVILTGALYDPIPVLRRAALAVWSARSDGFSNAMVEALACGTPVVATDCPYGPREILGDGRYGALVPVGDVDALADAITQAMNSKPDREALRARGSMHTAERAADALLGILDDVLSAGGAQSLPDFGGRGRHIDMADAPLMQRIHDRVD
jgi:glycosyltransferase involved in cell wall biosynthesis